jgi:hypothetical protein
MILLEMDKRVIPRQLLQSLRVPFLTNFIIMPLAQSSGIIFITRKICGKFHSTRLSDVPIKDKDGRLLTTEN